MRYKIEPTKTMLDEIKRGVDYLCQEILQGDKLPNVPWSRFKIVMSQALLERYHGHWYPSAPHRGCAYRCIRCTPTTIDNSFLQAVNDLGLELTDVLPLAPSNFQMWIDPGEVTAQLDSGENMVIASNHGFSPSSPPGSLQLSSFQQPHILHVSAQPQPRELQQEKQDSNRNQLFQYSQSQLRKLAEPYHPQNAVIQVQQ
eukprot:gene1386-4561_t